MLDKQKYTRFAAREKQLPVFHQPYWLDAVCGNEATWQVVGVRRGEDIVATMPLYFKKKDVIGQPPLTPYLGAYIKFPEGQKPLTKHRYEQEVLTELISNIPPFRHLKFNLLPERTNWLPFYWNHFNQTTRYTYLLHDLNPAWLFDQLKGSLRRQIRKAANSIKVEFSDDIELFHKINRFTFNRKQMAIPYSLGFLKRLDEAVKPQRVIMFGKDADGNIHAGLYLIWDENRAYYMMGGINPDYQNSGANPFLFWEAIKYAASFVQQFDFEGSMIPSVENFFASFSAEQTPYFTIFKDNRSFLRKLIVFLKSNR